jgi:hypothetical protein
MCTCGAATSSHCIHELQTRLFVQYWDVPLAFTHYVTLDLDQESSAEPRHCLAEPQHRRNVLFCVLHQDTLIGMKKKKEGSSRWRVQQLHCCCRCHPWQPYRMQLHS